jgi:hypothetical protein
MDRIQDNVEVEQNGSISRPVTETSRITGVRRTEIAQPAYAGYPVGTEVRSIDWQAVVASVCCGLAITAMLTLLGMAVGLIAGDESTDTAGEIGGILGAVGAWTIVAMCIGAFVGSVLGGRLARWLDRGSVGYHTLTSWGLATLLTIALAALVSIGFAAGGNAAANTAEATDTTATTTGNGDTPATPQPGTTDGSEQGQTGTDANSAEESANKAADTLGGVGAAIGLSMLLTLIASGAGWWIGSRKRLLDIEREPAPEVTTA